MVVMIYEVIVVVFGVSAVVGVVVEVLFAETEVTMCVNGVVWSVVEVAVVPESAVAAVEL